MSNFDPIELEILWQSLIATVNEQARALQRSAFSPIVREAGDLANRRLRSSLTVVVAQAVTGTSRPISTPSPLARPTCSPSFHKRPSCQATCW